MSSLAKLVDAFADSKRRNQAIVDLVGAINATDLRRVRVRPEAKAALISGLDHPNAKVRWWCLQLMDHLADESYLEPILAKLTDPVAKVRRHAIHALSCGACKPNREVLAVPIESALRAVLSTDCDPQVREDARHALERLGICSPIEASGIMVDANRGGEVLQMIRGSCLCGSVHFEVRGRVSPIQTCHCSRCRKTSGSAFSASLMCASKNFVWLGGQGEISVFQLPSGFLHAFCKSCGSPVPTPDVTRKVKSFPAGCLDDDPGAGVIWHTFVGSKAPWFEITDELPQHEKQSPEAQPREAS